MRTKIAHKKKLFAFVPRRRFGAGGRGHIGKGETTLVIDGSMGVDEEAKKTSYVASRR